MRRTTSVLLVVIGLLLAGPAAASPQTFVEHTLKTDWPAGHDVYATDLDGDGDTDVLGAAAMGSDDVIWWENDGSALPSFTEHVIDGHFFDAGEVYATDLNQDGHTDVLGVSGWEGDLTWWQNDGGAPPTFTKHTIEANFHGGNGVCAIDLDRDGDVDVLGTTSWSRQFAWWENCPTGNAEDPVQWTRHDIKSGYSEAATVFAVDLDGDGDDDVVTAWPEADEVSWFANNGNSPPSFTEYVLTDNLDYPNSVYAADVDDDHHTDILAAASLADCVKWWRNDGETPPTFTEYTVACDVGNPMGVFSTDLDGDDDNDVLAAGAEAGLVIWWENMPSSDPADPVIWTEHIIKSGWYGANRVYATDVDRDGDVDVLGTAYDTGEITLWENRTNDVPPGRIVFVSRRDGDIEIYTMDSDGSDVRRLTYKPGPDSAPSWSPNGTEILFTRGYGGDTTEIWVMDSDGTLIRKVGESYPIVADPRWSPDGSQIVFTIGGHTDKHLYVMQSDGSGLQQIADTCGGEASPDWSPDGSTIVFHADPVGCSYDTADTYLHLINPDGSNLRPLLDEEHGKIYGSWARYSPDGTLIAFEHAYRYAGGADCDIYTVNSDGSDVRPFQVGPYDDGLPVWSPDGQALAFMSSNRAATYVDIWVAWLDDPDNPIQLTTHPASDIAWDWWGPRPDNTAPSTTIDVDGTLGSDDWYVSTATVTLSAVDEPGGSGVAYTEYSTDGGATWTSYTEPFIIVEKGVTAVLAQSVDNAGNVEDPPVGEEVKVVLECQVLFHEDFSSDLSQWTLFGSPLSYIDTGLGNLAPSLQTHGDASYGSGLNSVEGFALSPGTMIVYDGRLQRLDWFNAFAVIPYRDWTCGEYTGDYAVRFEYGSSCPGGFCFQAAVRDSATTYEHSPNVPALPAGPYHRFKIEILEDSRVSFYAGDMSVPIWTSSVSVDTSYGAGPLCLNGRTAWLDNVTVISCDITPPSTTIDVDGSPGDNDWFVSPLTVTLSASDGPGGTGVAYTEYSLDEGGTWVTYTDPFTVADEGTTTVIARSVDNAGNVEDPPVSEELHIDFTPPIIVGSRTPGANTYGWNNEDVTAYFDCYDGVSGIATCTSDTVVTTEGKGQSVTGTARDMAGNPASTIVDDISIDKTAPTANIADLSPNPADVSESADLVAHLADELSGIQAAQWCAESETLACTWEAMMLTGEAGDLNRTASASISGLPAGVYSIKVKTQDLADNPSDVAQAFLVVYDPSAGFATGGGWIIPGTEPGDFLPGITGQDKANFGFVVKYKRGASTPDGQLEFHYRVGHFDLHSAEMHWMVINNNWAKFQGYATINLHPDELFHFRVDARDASQGDRFILKVWTTDQDPDLDDPIYRASGDLMGGNIIIHTR